MGSVESISKSNFKVGKVAAQYMYTCMSSICHVRDFTYAVHEHPMVTVIMPDLLLQKDSSLVAWMDG